MDGARLAPSLKLKIDEMYSDKTISMPAPRMWCSHAEPPNTQTCPNAPNLVPTPTPSRLACGPSPLDIHRGQKHPKSCKTSSDPNTVEACGPPLLDIHRGHKSRADLSVHSLTANKSASVSGLRRFFSIQARKSSPHRFPSLRLQHVFNPIKVAETDHSYRGDVALEFRQVLRHYLMETPRRMTSFEIVAL